MKMFAITLALGLAATACKKTEEPAAAPARVEPTTTEKLEESASAVVEQAKAAAADVKDATQTGVDQAKEMLRARVRQLETQMTELDNEAGSLLQAVQQATDAATRKSAQESLDKVREAKAAAQKKLDNARAAAAK